MARAFCTLWMLLILSLVSSSQAEYCPGKHFNLIFVIDSSGSIGADYYPENFVFVERVLENFEIEENKTRVALITYGTHPRLIIDNTGDKAYILEKLKKVPYQASTTHTGKALNFVLDKGLAGEPRQGVETIVVLVTDGKSTIPKETIEAADRVKAEGYHIFAVGVGKKVDWDELYAVVSNSSYVSEVDDPAAISENADAVADSIYGVTPCAEKHYNLIFVIDSSSSIGRVEFGENFEFVRKFLKDFKIGEEKTRVALITFGTHPRLIFNNTGNESQIYQKMENVTYQGSSTQTGRALRYIREKRLAGPPRAGVDTRVILITDGRPTVPEDALSAADALKNEEGYIIYAVGVGNRIKWDELQAIASRPEYVIKCEGYYNLSKKAPVVSHMVRGAVFELLRTSSRQ